MAKIQGNKLINIGISSCLLGEECNYSGGHNRCRYATENLSKYFNFIPFCPEHEVLGTPRETIRLVKDDTIKVVGNKSKKEYTSELKEVSKKVVKELKEIDISGYILKSKSPTCGIDSIKVYLKNGMPSSESSSGLLASEIMGSFKFLPLIDEGRLNDEWLTENFIMQVFAYKNWQDFILSSSKISNLVDFHTSYKFLLQAKSEKNYRILGNIVANRENKNFEELREEYGAIFLETIDKKNSSKPIVNVLQHMMGFLKDRLSKDEKIELLESINDFEKKIIPLIVPIKLLEHYINKYDIGYLKNQKFLSPYPKDLGLRSGTKAFK